MRLIPTDVVGKEIAPKPAAELSHGRTGAGERLDDEIEGPPQLEKKGEVAPGFLIGKPPESEKLEQLPGEGHLDGSVTRTDLISDVAIEPVDETVIDVEQESAPQKDPVLAGKLPQVGPPQAIQIHDLFSEPGKDRVDDLCFRESCRGSGYPSVQLGAVLAEGIDEGGLVDQGEKFPFPTG